MKKFISPFIGLSMLVLGSTAQERVEITAKMPELVNGDVVYLWNAFSGAKDSTYVKNNSFNISQEIAGGGSTYILQAGLDPEASGLGMIMMMQPGKMHIEGGNGTGFKGASFTGAPFVADWWEMDKAMREVHELNSQIDNLTRDYTEAYRLGDKEAVNRFIAEIQAVNKQVGEKGRQFLDTHLSSSASAYVMNALMMTAFTAREKVAYLNKFTGRAYDNHITKSMLRALTGTDTQWLGKQAPDFSVPDANGKMVSLKDFKGKYVLIDFWASWCLPCRSEVPDLLEAYNKFKDKNFTVVSISMDKDQAKWAQALKEESMPWLQLSDLKGDQSDAARAFNILAIPAKFLIDPSGKIIGTGFREENKKGGRSAKALDKALTELFK